ncbi:phosphoesterase [Aestuariibacter sp. A3R04]|uniref:phosphoesterase n=1 Tax=Aestuariibacter sp. A3R04 TaxID=2841571 RepID=UPI001C09F936|nr:phosphoesterase [Aestuariibacter sp. A3R04]MBU3020669.1 phosphoesterase [Aestuariibacter sp. A3R04]
MIKFRKKKLIDVFLYLSMLVPVTAASHGSGIAHELTLNDKVKGNSEPQTKQWLAGDHHIHSRFSVKWDYSTNPPSPILGGDARYSAEFNAKKAELYGLDWMVITDHGGPNHSKVNLEQAYPDLLKTRIAYPNILQFYGMEFDTPGARHSSLILPHSEHESEHLYFIEKNFNRREIHPTDIRRDTVKAMLNALQTMSKLTPNPLLFANHPGRTAKGLGEYTWVTPKELRKWNNIAPNVAIGMEGSPGHQASALNPDGSINQAAKRSGYKEYPTMGGFDQMTARLGGFWDSMLGEGRRWWITATSDSHVHYTDGRSDFWPGEYSKTYVFAEKNYNSIINALRKGHIFAVTGDLINGINVNVRSADGTVASIGEELTISAGSSVNIEVKVREPQSDKDSGNRQGTPPRLVRVDLITGNIYNKYNDLAIDSNPSTKVEKRFTASEWQAKGGWYHMNFTIEKIKAPFYIRIRGTNNLHELEPEPDPPGEDPWQDLWFYTNPVFVNITQ